MATGDSRLILLAHTFSATLYVHLQDPQAAARHVSDLTQLASSASCPEAEGPMLWLQGWCKAHLDDAHAGYTLIMQGYDSRRRLGLHCGLTEVLGFAAQALILAREWTRARQHLDQALTQARFGERHAIPQLRFLQACSAQGEGDLPQARQLLRVAREGAHNQGSPLQKFKALIAFIDQRDAHPIDLDELASLYNGFIALDMPATPLMVKARSLLQRHGYSPATQP